MGAWYLLLLSIFQNRILRFHCVMESKVAVLNFFSITAWTPAARISKFTRHPSWGREYFIHTVFCQEMFSSTSHTHTTLTRHYMCCVPLKWATLLFYFLQIQTTLRVLHVIFFVDKRALQTRIWWSNRTNKDIGSGLLVLLSHHLKWPAYIHFLALGSS